MDSAEIDALQKKLTKVAKDAGSSSGSVSTSVLSAGTKSYYNALEKTNKAINDCITKSDKFRSSGSDGMTELAGKIDLVRAKFENLKNTVSAADSGNEDYDFSLSDFGNEYAELRKEISDIVLEGAELKLQLSEIAESVSKTGNAASSAASAENEFASAIALTEKALSAYGYAQNDSNSSLRNAYLNLSSQKEALEKLQSQYEAGEISASNFKQSINAVSASIENSISAIRENGDSLNVLAKNMKAVTQKFATMLSFAAMINYSWRCLKNMASAAIELEDAMAQLQIVTKATDTELQSFLTESIGLAKELGQSITDVASAIETFTRLGYDFSDASDLAKYATILANVTDASVSDATTGLTSILKAYSLDASDAERIADILVSVGQEYAISADELMSAFERGGAALAATGASVEQSAALFAATNASLQNAETTGTLWKTVSARIRGATTELDELGESSDDCADGLSKYREEVKALTGVDIMIDDDTFKDTYNIFVEIASVWDELTDTQRSRVSEILGGTRQLSGIASTITNIADAMGAYETALNASGTATEANDIYLATTTAHLKQFQIAFQDLADSVVETDVLKGFIDLGTDLLNIITALVDSVGALPTLLTAVAAGFSAFKNVGRDKMYSLVYCKYADGIYRSFRIRKVSICVQ